LPAAPAPRFRLRKPHARQAEQTAPFHTQQTQPPEYSSSRGHSRFSLANSGDTIGAIAAPQTRSGQLL